MKNILLTAFLLITHFLNAQWKKTVFDKTNPDKKIDIANYSLSGETIWAKSSINSDTNIYFSTDGGYSFSSIKVSDLIPDYIYILNIYVVSNSHLYIKLFNSQSKHKLFYTTNGGKAWEEFNNIERDSAKEIPDGIFFYDTLRGSLIYANSIRNKDSCREIWNTKDGGKTWIKINCDSINISKYANFGLGFSYKKNILNYVGIDNFNTNGNNRMVISENYGQKWYFRETNIPSKNGTLFKVEFKDSLVGFAQYQSSVGLSKIASTIDGGRSWDTTFEMSDDYGSINLKYATPAELGDTGFWIGYSMYSNTNYGCFISYDDLKTIKKLDKEYHSNLIVYNTKKIISSVELNENLFIYTGKNNNVGIAKNIPKNYSVYPNPFQDEIHIKTSQNAELNIYNLEGKLFLTRNINAGENTLKLNDFVAGMYILEIKTGNQIERSKLVKTN